MLPQGPPLFPSSESLSCTSVTAGGVLACTKFSEAIQGRRGVYPEGWVKDIGSGIRLAGYTACLHHLVCGLGQPCDLAMSIFTLAG